MKIVDLFCGVGGASYGMHLYFPGAEIIGYDIESQPNYPFGLVVGDALDADLSGADFVWASPPCQAYSKATSYRDRSAYSDMIALARAKLLAWGGPFVIENTDGAPIRKDLTLCGQQLGLDRLFRHRHFESNFPMIQLAHDKHWRRVGYGDWNVVTVAGRGVNCPFDIRVWRRVMQMDWPKTHKELANAVPPAYAQYIMQQYAREYGNRIQL
jgi:hypothetical protein